MNDRGHDLPIAKQAKALGISCGSFYDLPRFVPTAVLAVMQRMDEPHLECPFAGSRMLCNLLNTEGITIGRCHVATLIKRLCIDALYRKPNTSKPAPGHKIYPYLLCGLTIDRPNQVWALNITLRSDGAWVHLLGRCHRLLKSPGAVLTAVDHDGG